MGRAGRCSRPPAVLESRHATPPLIEAKNNSLVSRSGSSRPTLLASIHGDEMASRAHRFPCGNTPLTGVHGGSAEAARRAIQESKAQLFGRARVIARGVVQRNHDVSRYADWEARGKPPSPSSPRKDRRRPRAVLTTLRHRLYEAQGGLCGICDGSLDCMSPPSLDHVMPRALGGKNEGNVLLAHSACNHYKADRPPTTRELKRLAEVNAKLRAQDAPEKKTPGDQPGRPSELGLQA